MEDEKIIKQILLLLDGWVLDDEVKTDELTDLDFNKSITSEEVLTFYNIAYNYALSYTKLSAFPTIVKTVGEGEEIEELSPQTFTALTLWSAGLIYRKYDIRSNDQIDESVTIGYGDSLIIQAKEMLKGYKQYNFYAY